MLESLWTMKLEDGSSNFNGKNRILANVRLESSRDDETCLQGAILVAENICCLRRIKGRANLWVHIVMFGKKECAEMFIDQKQHFFTIKRDIE